MKFNEDIVRKKYFMKSFGIWFAGDVRNFLLIQVINLDKSEQQLVIFLNLSRLVFLFVRF